MASTTELSDGGMTTVRSRSSGREYTIKRDGNVFYCDCPAWKFQKTSIDRRTCKHIKQLRGEEAERIRIQTGVVESIPHLSPVTTRMDIPIVVPKPVEPRSVETIMISTDFKKETEETSNDKEYDINMLEATTWSEGDDPTGDYMSEKMDGVWARWIAKDRVFVSKQGNVFHAPEWFKQGLPEWDLEGELFGGRGNFQETVGIVKRFHGGDLWKKINFLVFEAPTIDGVFEVRIKVTKRWFKLRKPPYASVINQTLCKGMEHLKAALDMVIEKGGEGLMLRKAGSNYVTGRSRTLLKVKKLHDAEAKVIGYTKGTGKYKGMMGALVVEMPNGKQFKIGTGFRDNARENPPPIGSVVTYQYQELTNGGLPRFARYMRVREDVTWESRGGNTRDPKTFPSRSEALKFARKKANEKESEGYTVVH